MNNFKLKAIWGTFFGVTEKIFSQSVLLISQIIMMRILTSKEYGQIGVLLIFFAVSTILIESGFSNALIQKKIVSVNDLSTAFWYNIFICILCYLAVFFSSSKIALFFGDPELKKISQILGIGLFFNTLGIIPQTILIKSMHFESIAKISFFSCFLSSIIGIIVVYQGLGVWAIVIQNISLSFSRSFFLIFHSKWIPFFVFSKKSFFYLSNFGKKMILSNILDQIFINLHVSIVGRFNSSIVGYYSQANKFSIVLFGIFSAPIHTVTMAIMSAANVNNEENKNLFFQKFIQISAFYTFPLVLGVIATTEPFFELCFSENWLPIIPIFIWFCAGNFFSPISVINQNVLKSNNRPDLLLRSNIIRKSFFIISILIGTNWGIKGILIAYFLSSIMEFFINAHFTSIILNISKIDQILCLWKIILNSLIMFGIVTLINNSLIENNLFEFLVKSITGIISYLLASFTINKENSMEALKVLSILVERLFHIPIKSEAN